MDAEIDETGDDSGELRVRPANDECQLHYLEVRQLIEEAVHQEGSPLAATLEQSGTEPLTLLRALELVDEIDGSSDRLMDWTKIIEEVFRLSKPTCRLDTLELLASLQVVRNELQRLNGHLRQRYEREDADAAALRDELAAQRETIKNQARTIQLLEGILGEKASELSGLQISLEDKEAAAEEARNMLELQQQLNERVEAEAKAAQDALSEEEKRRIAAEEEARRAAAKANPGSPVPPEEDAAKLDRFEKWLDEK